MITMLDVLGLMGLVICTLFFIWWTDWEIKAFQGSKSQLYSWWSWTKIAAGPVAKWSSSYLPFPPRILTCTHPIPGDLPGSCLCVAHHCVAHHVSWERDPGKGWEGQLGEDGDAGFFGPARWSGGSQDGPQPSSISRSSQLVRIADLWSLAYTNNQTLEGRA